MARLKITPLIEAKRPVLGPLKHRILSLISAQEDPVYTDTRLPSANYFYISLPAACRYLLQTALWPDAAQTLVA